MQIAPDIQLPSLPEVTLRALEACNQDKSYRSISDIVSADTALVSRVLALANSALYGPAAEIRSIDQALLRLGTHRFRTLVLTAALRQILYELAADQWQQLRDFWRHSLTTALTARALATLTRYPEPDQAFMLGMLHNVGELIALKTPPGDIQQYYFDHHADIAAELVSSWGLGPMAADAMRYQQAVPTEIRDAGHLVKLIGLSTRLALSDAAGIAAAGTIFGLNEELTREINRRIDQEVGGMAESLGIPLSDGYDASHSNDKLKQTILKQAMANQALELSSIHGNAHEHLAATVNSLTLITGLPALYFSSAGDGLTLLSASNGDIPDLTIASGPAISVLTEAFASGVALCLGDRPPTVLDRQLLSLLKTPSLVAIPVSGNDQCTGVFAVGTDRDNSGQTEELGLLFSEKLSQAVAAMQADSNDSQDSIKAELARDTIRRQVHEVSNPLTIIRQYIYQLRNRLEDDEIQEELDVIRDELDRASDLLLQISRAPDHGKAELAGACNLNDELRILRDLLEDSLFSDNEKALTLDLCDESTDVTVPGAVIRQVVINLVRNAVESLPEGGKVSVHTLAPVWQNGKTWVELEIADTGNGIPADIRKNLFSPVQSTKGKGHSGLGLSVVKQLIDDMEGIINCRTGRGGTAFRILFPSAANNKNDDE
ncbi:HDOD domain-containing protein [Marinobacter orientalis]|uniref:histidine kinase n=1 Tax=Marinobacter orientalis TaxID=1928859 RepID=A0A7Y0RDD5_9GAMM|nr:HDOD domain-containing protein [Marinobacter orientalis]NMT64186.1 HDOD domain-containing protein [Marinobacter orientalis]TGX49412.1 HDOD domain-containing protein [Marinobacter orientalis]